MRKESNERHCTGRTIEKQHRLQAAQRHERAATQPDATPLQQRVEELKQELATLLAQEDGSVLNPSAERSSKAAVGYDQRLLGGCTPGRLTLKRGGLLLAFAGSQPKHAGNRR